MINNFKFHCSKNNLAKVFYKIKIIKYNNTEGKLSTTVNLSENVILNKFMVFAIYLYVCFIIR